MITEYSINWEEKIIKLLMPYLIFCFLKECVNKHKIEIYPKMLALNVGVMCDSYFLPWVFLKFPQEIIFTFVKKGGQGNIFVNVRSAKKIRVLLFF